MQGLWAAQGRIKVTAHRRRIHIQTEAALYALVCKHAVYYEHPWSIPHVTEARCVSVCVCVCVRISQCVTVCWHAERKGGMTVIYQGDGGLDGITNAKTCSTAHSTSLECCNILHSFSRNNARLHLCQHPALADRQQQGTNSPERTEYTHRHQLAKWLNIFDLPMLGAETLCCITKALAETMRSWGALRRIGRKIIHSRPILPVPSVDLISLPTSRRGAEGFVCVSASLATVPLGCAGPPTPSLTGSGVRQAFTPRNDYFLLPPALLPLLHDEPKAPLHPKCRLLTYLAVSSLIQKTSKQMRSSPVQRCRPAARASCQETPHTCWLCTFPGKQRQMSDGGGE